MNQPLYSIGTYDWEERCYSPQAGLSVPSFNITFAQLRQALRELRRMGYECHRDDSSVLVERTDGKPEAEIFREWNPRKSIPNPTPIMAKKKAATKASADGDTATATAPKKTAVKKSKKKGDLPGQKVMPHGPKKVTELEEAGAKYAEAEAAVEAA